MVVELITMTTNKCMTSVFAIQIDHKITCAGLLHFQPATWVVSYLDVEISRSFWLPTSGGDFKALETTTSHGYCLVSLSKVWSVPWQVRLTGTFTNFFFTCIFFPSLLFPLIACGPPCGHGLDFIPDQTLVSCPYASGGRKTSKFWRHSRGTISITLCCYHRSMYSTYESWSPREALTGVDFSVVPLGWILPRPLICFLFFLIHASSNLLLLHASVLSRSSLIRSFLILLPI